MKKLLHSRVFLLVWLVICALASLSLGKHLADVSRAEKRLQLTEERATALEKENAEKKLQIEDANSPFEREKMIREQLGMQKAGEFVVQVAQNSEPLAFSASSSVVLRNNTIEIEKGNIFSQFGQIIQGVFFRLKDIFFRQDRI